jgi:hypothetical protein
VELTEFPFHVSEVLLGPFNLRTHKREARRGA